MSKKWIFSPKNGRKSGFFLSKKVDFSPKKVEKVDINLNRLENRRFFHPKMIENSGFK